MKLSFHKNHKLLFGVVFFGFIGLSLIIAVGPAFWVQDHNKPIPGSKPMTKLQKEGMRVYIDEGCEYCHTQQVRPLAEDKVWGRPSTPGDYAHVHRLNIWQETPNVLGTERTGPDLSNVGKRRASKTWNYIHLYDPRSVVKQSVMPAFHWLFKVEKNPGPNETVVPVPKQFAPKNGKVVPTQRAKALIAYVLSLKQTPLPNGQQKTTESQNSGGGQQAAASGSKLNGKNIFVQNCAACHQQNGKGVPGAFPPLAGDPVVNNIDPTEHIETVLYGKSSKTIGGVKYSAQMPPLGESMSNAEVAAVINYERTHFGNHGKTITPQDVAKIRNQDKQNKTAQ
ncbi:MAG TPA: cbb3-type cytochrome c oxidase subunit II [Balneolaceae bacterium]|nr:cbb3-type cytochrome c oxidase subunit II [Balneolales bacterium]HKK45620.1 cbb3-type cytochrome c oxidase subunit II [Balneolaceae bacterium]